jgi:hypothetical protein
LLWTSGRRRRRRTRNRERRFRGSFRRRRRSAERHEESLLRILLLEDFINEKLEFASRTKRNEIAVRVSELDQHRLRRRVERLDVVEGPDGALERRQVVDDVLFQAHAAEIRANLNFDIGCSGHVEMRMMMSRA